MEILQVPFVAGSANGTSAIAKMKKTGMHSFVTQVGDDYYVLGPEELVGAMQRRPDGLTSPLSGLMKHIPAQKLPALEVPRGRRSSIPQGRISVTSPGAAVLYESLLQRNALVGLATVTRTTATIVTRREVYAQRFHVTIGVWECNQTPRHIYLSDELPGDKVCPKHHVALKQLL
jgi:hypothetical protein